jgi:hypothetical protein
MRHTVRTVVFTLGFFGLMANAHAQLGPSSARVISREMPSKAPAVQTFTAEAELLVTRRGGVDFVKIIAGSGDEAFDKQWKKSLSDWRFVPAVDEAGQPYESNVNVIYKTNGISVLPSRPVGSSAGDAATAKVLEESERFDRMTCKDFLWEYEIVSDVLPRRLALLDPLLKTPLVMMSAEPNVNGEQLKTLRERYDPIVSQAAKQCRDDPAAPFWSGVMKPSLLTGLTQ